MEESPLKLSDDFKKKTGNHFTGSQTERWETLFDPHYTFTKSTKYVDPMIVREKGLERQASIILQHKTPLQHRSASLLQLASSASTLPVVIEEKELPLNPKYHQATPSSSSLTESLPVKLEDQELMSLNSISATSSPTLPCMQDLIRPTMDQPNQTSILPCPSQSLDDLQKKHLKDKNDMLKVRLELLNSIHQGPGRHVVCMNVGAETNVTEQEQEKSEEQDDGKLSTTVTQKDSFTRRWWHVRQIRHPCHRLWTKVEQLKEESELPYFTTQLLLQEKKKKSASGDLAIEIPPIYKRYRPSFLYFFFGFFFPPLWIVGALYMKRSEKMTKADYQWKKRSRHALVLMLVLILLVVLVIVIFKPSLLGWRNSQSHTTPL